MPANPHQQFYFHADAVSLGGYFDGPNGGPATLINTPSSVALSSAGGISQSTTKSPTNLPSGITVASATTLVAGEPTQGGWIQRSTSIIEGLNIFGAITADSLIAQISVLQTVEGEHKVTFAGTTSTNLKIDGKPITIDFRSDLVPPVVRAAANSQATPHTPDLEWNKLTNLALTQNQEMFNNQGASAATAPPQWITDRYGWIKNTKGEVGPGGYTLCSLVDKIGGIPGTYGHCIDVPDIGRICVAEVIVYARTAQITLINTEFNGKKPGTKCGRTAVCMLFANGTSVPPT